MPLSLSENAPTNYTKSVSGESANMNTLTNVPEIDLHLTQAKLAIEKCNIDPPSSQFVYFLTTTDHCYSNFQLRCALAATQVLLKDELLKQ